jgi:arginyl-tRNA--protein-N-Asp/Glu arginylyltransferase
MRRRSPGSFVILDHVIQACLTSLPYVYLGYWVRGSEKMDYKVRFSPIELLKAEGWTLIAARDARPAGRAA